MRAIEIGHIVAGPTAGLLLSDLGFEVIKVERPKSGDIARSLTGTSSGAFAFYNRNKKSVTIDFKQKEGRDVLMKLIGTSDVLIDNLGYGALESAGLSYDEMKKHNPGLIYLSIRGYGNGPYEKRKSLDFPIEIHSGLAYMTGTLEKPMRVGASMIDMSAAMFGVIAVLDAIIEREKTGKGKQVTIGMFETALFFMGQHITTYQLIGKELKPINEDGFAWGIYDFFTTKDNKKVFVAVTTEDQWKKFCEVFSLSFCDEFPTNAIRYSKRDTLIPMLQDVMGKFDSTGLVERLESANISYAVLNKPWDLLNDPHASAKMISEEYCGRKIMVPYSPIGYNYVSDPPKLGDYTREVLRELGYSDYEIDYMEHNGIV